jgi:hypothetical protein
MSFIHYRHPNRQVHAYDALPQNSTEQVGYTKPSTPYVMRDTEQEVSVNHARGIDSKLASEDSFFDEKLEQRQYFTGSQRTWVNLRTYTPEYDWDDAFARKYH